jgi:hypothetical protein
MLRLIAASRDVAAAGWRPSWPLAPALARLGHGGGAARRHRVLGHDPPTRPPPYLARTTTTNRWWRRAESVDAVYLDWAANEETTRWVKTKARPRAASRCSSTVSHH